jgi:cobyrinic acid a,c-diamide synthase
MEPRLCSLGYREIVTREESLLGPPGTRVKGHEFHYSRILGEKGVRERIYRVRTRKGTEALEGYGIKNTLGSYVHQHWGSNPEVAAHLVRSCRKE